MFAITVCIHITNTGVTVHPATAPHVLTVAAPLIRAYEPEDADVVGRTPGWIKRTTVLSQTETSNVPSLATKWLCNMLQVAKGQNTTAKRFLGQVWSPMTHFWTMVAELKSKSNSETIATNQTQKQTSNKQNMYLLSWHCFLKSGFQSWGRLKKKLQQF